MPGIYGPVAMAPFDVMVQMGLVPGHKILRGMGERNDIGTTVTGEDIWLGNDLSNTPAALASTTTIPRPADAGEQMSLISESAEDGAGSSTGALTVRVVYIDAAGDEQSTDVTMNGTTAVDLTPSDVRFVQEIHSVTTGSNKAAAGNIRIYKTSDATLVYSMIAAGGNMSLVPHRMVPAGKTLYLRFWLGTEVRGKRDFVRLRADCDNAVPPVRQPDVFLFKSTIGVNKSGVAFPLAYTIPALCVVKASAFAVNTAGEASVHWWGILKDD